MSDMDRMEARIKKIDALLDMIERRMQTLAGMPEKPQEQKHLLAQMPERRSDTYVTVLADGTVRTKNFYGFDIHDSTV